MTVVWADRSNAPTEVRYGLHWSAGNFDDSTWKTTDCRQSASSTTDVHDSRGRTLPIYVRHAFTLRNAAGIKEAKLLLYADADYVAYINGVEVATPERVNLENTQGTPVDAKAPRPPERVVAFDVSDRIHDLHAGQNVIAIWVPGGWSLEKVTPLFALELTTADGLKRIGPGAWIYSVGYDEPRLLDHSATADYRLIRALDGHYQHSVRLTGLQPGTTYAYQIGPEGDEGADTYSLRTAPSGNDFTFVAFADSGTGSTAESGIRNLLLGEDFDLAIVAGDISEQLGTYQNYQATYFQPFADLIARKAFVTVPGNHDYDTDHAAAYRDVFVEPGSSAPEGSLYFSFDYGSVHFVGLDSEEITDEQVAWLRTDLASTTQPWKIVYMHRPPFGEGSFHPINEDGAVLVRRRLVPVFEEFGVDVVMAAHNAVYGRTPPLTNGRVTPPYAQVAEQGGVIYITTGGAGEQPVAAYTDQFHQPPLGVSVSANHYTRVDVTECMLTINAIDISGAVIDSPVIERCP